MRRAAASPDGLSAIPACEEQNVLDQLGETLRFAPDDLEPVRKRPGMYIGGVGSTGLHHLVWEILDNSVDEAMNGYASNITVTLHDDASSITISDDGRGIPIDKHPKTKKSAVEVIFTTLHAGGKFESGSYKTAGGLHGVGASVVNALSKELVATIRRDGAEWELRYKQGNPIGALTKNGAARGSGDDGVLQAGPHDCSEDRVRPGRHQAAARGVEPSAQGCEENKELTDLVTALGCGLGKNFDLARLRYGRIIILADADSDGHHIATLLMTFIYRHMQGLITAGRVFLAQPPLFRIDVGKDTFWALDEAHRGRLLKLHGNGRANPEITRFKRLGEMMPKVLWETTMNPRTRRLLRVEISDQIVTDKVINELMSKDPSARFRFIMDRAEEAVELDV